MTQLNQLHNEIVNELQRYSRAIEEQILKDAKETTQELVQDLKKGNKPYEDRTGDYSKGWRLKKKGKKAYVAFNATDYQLTHLLEHGHAKRGGGRVPAYVHIAPAEDKAVTAFLEKVERAVRQ